MYALETCKSDSISLPNLCIVKKKKLLRSQACIAGEELACSKTGFTDSQHRLWLRSSIFTMCPQF